MHILLKVAFVLMAGVGCSIVQAGDPEKQLPYQRRMAVEIGLKHPFAVDGSEHQQHTLVSRMRHFRVPGVSIAVIHNNSIDWARSYGVRNRETRGNLDPDTLFQAGSLSKPVASVLALQLVESGKLQLDIPLRFYQRSWRLPRTVYNADKPVTLRHILTHTSGLNLPQTPGYHPAGSIPTMDDILAGNAPSRTPELQLISRPGTEWKYSNGGFVVLQKLLEDISNLSFNQTARERLFSPLGMENSTFAQPLIGLKTLNAAAGHTADGQPVEGGWRVYPELAAAGLWTTPEEYAVFLISLMQAWQGAEGGNISRNTARALLNKELNGFGLGLWVDGSGKELHAWHHGQNHGYRSSMLFFPARGDGVVVMANGELAETFIEEIILAVADIYNWSAPEQHFVQPGSEVADGMLRYVAGTYRTVTDAEELVIDYRDGTLYMRGRIDPESMLVPQSPTSYVALDRGWQLTFDLDSNGAIHSLHVRTRYRTFTCRPDSGMTNVSARAR